MRFKANYTDWGSVACWSLREAIALVSEENPKGSVIVRPGSTYGRVADLAQRAIQMGLLTEPIIPRNFLDWADENGIRYPEELGVQVRKSQAAIPKIDVAALIAERNNLREEVRKLKETEKPPHTKEFNTALKLIAGLAVASYKHNPRSERSSAIGSMANALAKVGISIDEDTIRKYVRRGEEYLPEINLDK